jgi:hypothetical protein
MAIKTKSKINMSFIAGFLDGDGCIYMHKMKDNTMIKGYFMKPQIQFAQLDKNILLKIQQTLGPGKFYEQSYKNKKIKHTHYLRYDSYRRLKKLVIFLSKSYLSDRNKIRIKPILKYLNIKPKYKKYPDIDWVRGFMWAEGGVGYNYYKNAIYKSYYISQKTKDVLYGIKQVLDLKKIKNTLHLLTYNNMWVLRISSTCNDKFEKTMNVRC